MDDDRLRLVGRFVHDRDLARLDDVKRQSALAGLKDGLAVLERAQFCQSGQAFDLGVAELREREVMHVINGLHDPTLPDAGRFDAPDRRSRCCDRRQIVGRSSSLAAPFAELTPEECHRGLAITLNENSEFEYLCSGQPQSRIFFAIGVARSAASRLPRAA